MYAGIDNDIVSSFLQALEKQLDWYPQVTFNRTRHIQNDPGGPESVSVTSDDFLIWCD